MQNEELYKKYLAGRHWEQHPMIYAEKFSDFLKNKNFNGLLVDLGCGTGRDVNIFHQKGFDILGIDKAEEEIYRADYNFPELKFRVADAEDLKMSPESVGAFFAINIIHYLDQEKAFTEIRHTLKLGGFLFIHFNLSIVDKDSLQDYQKSEEEVLKLFEGFKILEKNLFTRVDLKPFEHTHTILEVIAEKI